MPGNEHIELKQVQSINGMKSTEFKALQLIYIFIFIFLYLYFNIYMKKTNKTELEVLEDSEMGFQIRRNAKQK